MGAAREGGLCYGLGQGITGCYLINYKIKNF